MSGSIYMVIDERVASVPFVSSGYAEVDALLHIVNSGHGEHHGPTLSTSDCDLSIHV